MVFKNRVNRLRLKIRGYKPKRRFHPKKVTPIKVSRNAFPSSFTIMNMVCGYISIILSSQHQFVLASLLIILATVFDTIDGLAARLTHSASEFGVELDSLSDLVSFGAAPSFLVYSIGLHEYHTFGIGLSALLMVSGGFRLARFNSQLTGFDKSHFSGLPIPAQAITIATFVISIQHTFPEYGEYKNYFLIPLVIILSILMVSKIHYEVLPKPDIHSIRKSPIKFGLYVFAFCMIIIFQAPAFFIVMCLYIVYGMLKGLYYFLTEETI